MTIWRANSVQMDDNGSETGMTTAKDWPYNAQHARDETAELVMDASRDLMSFIRNNNVQDTRLMSALLNLQQAQTFLVSVGAQIRPERL